MKQRIPIIQMILIGILPTVLKRLYYRRRGAIIGKNVRFGIFSYISASHIEIGDGVVIGAFSFIVCRELRLGNRVVIGSLVAIQTGVVCVGEDSMIMEQVVIGGMLTPRSSIRIGERTKIFPYCFLNPTEPIEIGDEVGIGGANYIFTHGSWQSVLEGFPATFGPVRIESGVWLPWRVFVMPHVTIGAYATIGASSTVTKDVPARALAAGTPAKVLRSGEEYIKLLQPNEQHQRVLKILGEFVEYLCYQGYPAKLDLVPNGCHIKVALARKKEWNIYYTRDFVESTIGYQQLITLLPLSAAQFAQLLQSDYVFFDIAGKRTRVSQQPMWQETRDYFSRYGIRFKAYD